MSSNNKDIEQYLRQLRAEGLQTRVNGNDHWEILKDGVVIARMAGSASDRRSIRNCKRDVNVALGRSKRGKVAAPPPHAGSDPEVLDLYRQQVRRIVHEGGDLDAVYLDWLKSGEPITGADLQQVLIEEEQGAC